MKDLINNLESQAALIANGEPIDVNAISALMAEAASRMREQELSADRWNALIGCARIRYLGSAGLTKDNPDGYAHLSVELWTRYDGEGYSSDTESLAKFADKAIAVNKNNALDEQLNATKLALQDEYDRACLWRSAWHALARDTERNKKHDFSLIRQERIYRKVNAANGRIDRILSQVNGLETSGDNQSSAMRMGN